MIGIYYIPTVHRAHFTETYSGRVILCMKLNNIIGTWLIYTSDMRIGWGFIKFILF